MHLDMCFNYFILSSFKENLSSMWIKSVSERITLCRVLIVNNEISKQHSTLILGLPTIKSISIIAHKYNALFTVSCFHIFVNSTELLEHLKQAQRVMQPDWVILYHWICLSRFESMVWSSTRGMPGNFRRRNCVKTVTSARSAERGGGSKLPLSGARVQLLLGVR